METDHAPGHLPNIFASYQLLPLMDTDLSPIELARIVEHTEAAAYAEQLRIAPADWHCVAEQTSAGWFLMAPSLDILLFNRLVGWGLDAPADPGYLKNVVGQFRAAGLSRFGVQLAPVAAPPQVEQWLGEVGVERRDNWSKVYRAAGAIPRVASDLRIEEIGRSYAPRFASIACASFGMPTHLEPWIGSLVGRAGWHHYLAFDGSEPVATGALFVQGDIGWLGVAGTLPTARRRGAQGALMERRLRDGSSLGCRWFVTETGEDTPQRPNSSYHNMLRLGFTLAYNRPNYLAV